MEENVWSHNKIKNPELKKSGLQKIRGYVCKSETKKKKSVCADTCTFKSVYVNMMSGKKINSHFP